MKKPVLLLFILGALCGFAIYYQQSRDTRLNSARLTGAPLRSLVFPNLPMADVRKIIIKDGAHTTSLYVKGDAWVVGERNDFPASYERIQSIVSNLADLKILGKQTVGKGALAEINLLTPADGVKEGAGVLIELQNEKGEVLNSLVAGNTVESTGGANSNSFMGGPGVQRFVCTPKDENTVWLVGEGLNDLSAMPTEWISKNLVDVTRIKSVEVIKPDANESWKAQRAEETAEFVFAESKNGDELDTAKASGLNSLMAAATLIDIAPSAILTPEVMKNATSAKVVTFDGFTYDFQFVDKKGAPSATAEPSQVLKVTVTADLPKARPEVANEKPEEKKSRDEAFESEKKRLEEKFAKEQSSSRWVYEVSNYTLGDLLKKRSELVRDKNAPAATEGAGGQGAPPAIGGFRMRMPGGQTSEVMIPQPSAAPAPAQAPAPAPAPVTVTTPPVSVDSAKPAAAPAAAPAEKPAPAPAPAEKKP